MLKKIFFFNCTFKQKSVLTLLLRLVVFGQNQHWNEGSSGRRQGGLHQLNRGPSRRDQRQSRHRLLQQQHPERLQRESRTRIAFGRNHGVEEDRERDQSESNRRVVQIGAEQV